MNIHKLYGPIVRHFRTKRMPWFQELLGITPRTSVLDVGGDSFYWSFMSVRPRLTILNLRWPKESPGKVAWVVADALRMPFKDRSFDVIFSNSVIEHLGDISSQQTFAKEIKRVAVRYFVQTPNRWFPVDPHVLTPFIHFLSKQWQGRLVRNFTIWGLITRPSPEYCKRVVGEMALLDVAKLRELFPEAEIHEERFLGLTKSLIAVRRSSS